MPHAAPDRLKIGELRTIPHDSNKVTVEDVVCCIHCGYTFVWAAGKTKGRGWCGKCHGLLCGRRHCRDKVPCRHWMHGIEAVEAGQSIDSPKKIIVPTSF